MDFDTYRMAPCSFNTEEYPEGFCDCDSTVAKDCEGTCGGSAVADCADTCNGDAIVDCEGTCGGSADCTIAEPTTDGWVAVPEGAKEICFDWDAASPTSMM